MEEELTIFVSEKDLEEFPETDSEENNKVRVRKEQLQNSTAVKI